MARPATRDPLDKFRWSVAIDGFSKLGFSAVTTPEYEITTKNYPEGGAHLFPKPIIDSVTYKPVTLSRGVTNDTSFNKWATAHFDLITNNAGVNINSDLSSDPINTLLGAAQNNGAKPIPSSSSQPAPYRRNVKIEHVNSLGQTEVVYILHNAFPINYKPASDFDASGDDAVSIETLTLAYESFEVRYTSVAGVLGSALTGNLVF